MTNRYRSIFPMSQQPVYRENDNVDFYLNLDGEKLVPGSLCIEGKIKTFSNRGTNSTPGGTTNLYYDPVAGAHALFRDITTEFQKLGIVENFQNYPRYVKMHGLANLYDESLGTETNNAVELRCYSLQQAKGMLEGQNTATDGAGILPFSVIPLIAPNKASAPLSASSIGQVRIRIRLAPAQEFYFGEDYVSGQTNYDITELKVRFQTIPDDGVKNQIQLEMYHTYRSVLDSNNSNVSTFVPGLCDSVQMSFIRQTDENTPALNYLACQPPVGQPPIGYSNPGVSVQDYGIERINYVVNDTQDALTGFTLESREEILENAFRAFKTSALRYEAALRRLRHPVNSYKDGYLAGIPFGGLINFQTNKFATKIQSGCDSGTNLFAMYLYFRMAFAVTA